MPNIPVGVGRLRHKIAFVFRASPLACVGAQIKGGKPEIALYAFAFLYAVCLVLNWWYYLGPKAEYDNP